MDEVPAGEDRLPLFCFLQHVPFLHGESAPLHSPLVLLCSQVLHLAFFFFLPSKSSLTLL